MSKPKKLKIFRNGVQFLDVDAEYREEILSIVEYDQYVNYMTDPIPQSREFIVSVLFIKDGEVRQREFEGVKSVDVFNEQPLPSI